MTSLTRELAETDHVPAVPACSDGQCDGSVSPSQCRGPARRHRSWLWWTEQVMVYKYVTQRIVRGPVVTLSLLQMATLSSMVLAYVLFMLIGVTVRGL